MCTRTLLMSIPALALLTVVGCANQDRGPIEPHAQHYANGQIHMDSYKLQQDTNIDRAPRKFHDDAGILHVIVPIRSVIDRPFTVQYRVRFFDRNGHQSSEIGWTDKPLTPNTPDQIEANSSGPAEDFEMDLRLPPGYDR